jgi:hypothetical protein
MQTFGGDALNTMGNLTLLAVRLPFGLVVDFLLCNDNKVLGFARR